MKHEKIIRREDGSRVKIEVSIYLDSYRRGEPVYSFETSKCEKGKRTWKYPHSENDYVWRALDIKGRNEYSKNKYLYLVSKEEVMEAYIELWEKIKPTMERI